MKLWHCKGSRSLRAIWALEEMYLNYELEVLPFPPRRFKKEYLDVNPLGTVPYFTDGKVEMTESTAICLYLVEKYEQWKFGLQSNHAEYGNYLNWLHHADATLTFPQTIAMRYYFLEPSEEKQAVADDYVKWYLARLRKLDQHLEQSDYLVDERFTIADIAVAYALFLGEYLKLDKQYAPQTAAYLARLKQRPAFQKAESISEP